MRLLATSRLLLGAGVAIGAAGSAGMFFGVDPVPAAGWLVDVAMYKLVFIASGGLLVAGAVVGRWAHRTQLAAPAGRGALGPSKAPGIHSGRAPDDPA